MENENQTQQEEAPARFEMVEQAVKAAERLETANKQMAELIARQEKLQAFAALGGKSQISQEQPKSETPAEYAKRVMSNKI